MLFRSVRRRGWDKRIKLKRYSNAAEIVATVEAGARAARVPFHDASLSGPR